MIGAKGVAIPPNGQSFEGDFCTAARWNDKGAIVEDNLFYDVVGMMRQLGLGARCAV